MVLTAVPGKPLYFPVFLCISLYFPERSSVLDAEIHDQIIIIITIHFPKQLVS